MVAEQERGLVPADLRPGTIKRGFAEGVLTEARRRADPVELWHGSIRLGSAARVWNGHAHEKAEVKAAQMFCEVLLGELLGPRPGGGNQHTSLSHAISDVDGLIPQPRVSELQRFFRWTDRLLDEIRAGTRSRRSLLFKVDQWEADERVGRDGEPEIGDLDIRRGDFREALAEVLPGSVALVLTDPPYGSEYLPLWDDLGAWAAQALSVGGSLVAYSGQAHLPAVFDGLRPHLRYWWTFCLLHGQSQVLPVRCVSAGWKPLLWFVREERATTVIVPDRLMGSGARKGLPTGDTGDWAQGVEEVAPIISGLTSPGDLIVDPFAGSGSFGLAALRYGRRFVGAEVRS